MDGIASYIDALFWVFIILVLARVLMSWLPEPTTSGFWRSIWDFVAQSTDWYLNIFRRIIPPIGMIDISPIAALIVLSILQNVVVHRLLGA
jgi:YggT family protein